MLTLNDGRKELYQWDTGRTATVDIECDVVHFANLKYGESLAVEVEENKVAIPNKLLTSGEPIYCWAFAKDDSGSYTKKEQTLDVVKRAKPSDYVYTETEVITIQTAVENALEEAKESGAFKGDSGASGKDGTSVTVSSVSESTVDGGENIVTFSDGKILTVKNGSKGSKGEDGVNTVVQEIGQSETEVMSQKASTDNFAAKADLIALRQGISEKLPKNPADWGQWTEEEQAVAKERIGISEDYELIDTITLEEESYLSIKDISLKEVSIIVNIYAAEVPRLLFNINHSASYYVGRLGNINYNPSFDFFKIGCSGSYLFFTWSNHTNSAANGEKVYRYCPMKISAKSITSIRTVQSPFPAGTKITILGVKV